MVRFLSLNMCDVLLMFGALFFPYSTLGTEPSPPLHFQHRLRSIFFFVSLRCSGTFDFSIAHGAIEKIAVFGAFSFPDSLLDALSFPYSPFGLGTRAHFEMWARRRAIAPVRHPVPVVTYTMQQSC